MRWLGFFFIFMGIKMATDGVLRGLGIMRPFLAANMVNLAIRLSVALICAPRFGIAFVWLCCTGRLACQFPDFLCGSQKILAGGIEGTIIQAPDKSSSLSSCTVLPAAVFTIRYACVPLIGWYLQVFLVKINS